VQLDTGGLWIGSSTGVGNWNQFLDTLANVLAGGNTTGGTDIVVDANQAVDVGFTAASAALKINVSNPAGGNAPKLRMSYEETTDILTLSYERTDGVNTTATIPFA
jgi:hypothetical protein